MKWAKQTCCAMEALINTGCCWLERLGAVLQHLCTLRVKLYHQLAVSCDWVGGGRHI